MKFLFRCEVKAIPPMPTDQWLEIAIAQAESMQNYSKEGKIAAGGPMAGRKGGYAVFDVDSIEELQAIVSQMPMFPFMETEIVPLSNWEDGIEGAKQALEFLRSPKK